MAKELNTCGSTPEANPSETEEELGYHTLGRNSGTIFSLIWILHLIKMAD